MQWICLICFSPFDSWTNVATVRFTYSIPLLLFTSYTIKWNNTTHSSPNSNCNPQIFLHHFVESNRIFVHKIADKIFDNSDIISSHSVVLKILVVMTNHYFDENSNFPLQSFVVQKNYPPSRPFFAAFLCILGKENFLLSIFLTGNKLNQMNYEDGEEE